jgi:DnaK suppressor protein
MSTRATNTAIATARQLDEVKAVLTNRRAALLSEVHDRMRDVRADANVDRDGLDEAESAEVGVQEEIGFALIQLKAETLERIDDALRRIEAGDYGDCSSCGAEISEARLRALPFALRCKECEEARETAASQRHSLLRSSAAKLLAERS